MLKKKTKAKTGAESNAERFARLASKAIYAAMPIRDGKQFFYVPLGDSRVGVLVVGIGDCFDEAVLVATETIGILEDSYVG